MEQILKELENDLQTVIDRLKADLSAVRSNRPSIDLIENIQVSAYDQMMTVRQLGSISVIPPREISIQVWDKSTVGPIMKAIELARIGLSVTNDGNIIRAAMSQLGDERREELVKVVKKTGEEARIQIRSRRDEAMKKIKSAEDEFGEDAGFKAREQAQKIVDGANSRVEESADKKLQELGT